MPTKHARSRRGAGFVAAMMGLLFSSAQTSSDGTFSEGIAQAATYYWDINGATAGATNDGAGIASGAFTGSFWSTDSNGGTATTAIIPYSDLVFSAGTNATGASAITGSGTQLMNSLSVEEGTVTFASGTFHFPAGVNVANGATLNFGSTIGGYLFSKTGAGTLTMTGNNLPLGVFNVNGPIAYTTTSTLSKNTVVGVGNGAVLSLDTGTASQTIAGLADSAAGGGAINNASATAGTTTFTINANLGSSWSYSGSLNGGTRAYALTKSGAGTQTFKGANNLSGTTTLAFGTLALDYSADNSLKLSTGALTLQGGRLTMLGNSSSSTSHTFTSLTLATGNSGGSARIAVTSGSNQTANLNLGAITRSSGAGSLDVTMTNTGFGLATVTTSSPNTGYGLLGTGTATTSTGVAYATVDGGRDWAVNSNGTSAGTGNVMANGSYSVDDSPSNWGTNQHISSSASGFNGNFSNTVSINSLRFAGTSTVNNGGVLTIRSGGILVSPDVVGASGISFGNITSSVGELIVHQYNKNADFTITSTITGSIALVKVGPGTVVLGGANSYSGTTRVHGGILAVTANDALGLTGGTTIVAEGGTLELRNTNGPSGFVYGSNEIIDISHSRTGYNGLGGLYVTGGKTTFGGVLTIAGDGGFMNNSLNVAAGSELEYSGVAGIGNGASGTLTKFGAGTLNITGTMNQGSSNSGFNVAGGDFKISGSGVVTGILFVLTNNSRLVLDNTAGNVANRITRGNTFNSSGFVFLGNASADSTEFTEEIVSNMGHNLIEVHHGGTSRAIVSSTHGNPAAPGLGRANNATALIRGTHLGADINAATGTSILRNGGAFPTQVGSFSLNTGASGTGTFDNTRLNYQIIPYFIGQEGTTGYGDTFVVLDKSTTTGTTFDVSVSRGIVPLTVTNFDTSIDAATNTTNNVRITGNHSISNAIKTINSLIVHNTDTNNAISISGTGPSSRVAITSGALLSSGPGNVVITSPISFSTSTIEGVVFVTGSGKLTLNQIVGTTTALTKSGPGVLALDGTTTITGAVTVNDGTLMVNTSAGTGTGAVAVRYGATLGGIGSVVGPVTVDLGGTLSPGNSPGVFGTGNLFLLTGSNYKVEIAGTAPGTFDKTVVTGFVDLNADVGAGANLQLDVSGLSSGDIGTSFDIIANDGIEAVVGKFAGLNQGDSVTVGNYVFTISYTGEGINPSGGNDVVLTLVSTSAVPEPGSVALMILGGTLLAGIKHRRRKNGSRTNRI